MKKGLKDTNVKQSLPWLSVSAPRQPAQAPGDQGNSSPGKAQKAAGNKLPGRRGCPASHMPRGDEHSFNLQKRETLTQEGEFSPRS